jgi:hypothetical protein
VLFGVSCGFSSEGMLWDFVGRGGGEWNWGVIKSWEDSAKKKDGGGDGVSGVVDKVCAISLQTMSARFCWK